MFVYTLKDFKILDSLCCITADNASNNNTHAKHVSELTNQGFNHHKILLGCMAHVINLAAQDGLKFFGTSAEGDPNAEISINSIHVCGSPQRREVFSGFVQIVRTSEAPADFELPESKEQTATSLILDVKTCWNSTYMMLNRAYNLRHRVSLQICVSDSQHRHSNVYRTHERNHISQKKYDASQLLAPADEMVKKLKKYLIPALKKPGPICAMILDPHIKTTHFENNWQFLLNKLTVHMTPDACSNTVVPISSASQQNIKSKIEQSIFAPRKQLKIDPLIFSNIGLARRRPFPLWPRWPGVSWPFQQHQLLANKSFRNQRPS
ncbi:uncharacterized protein VP01_4695g1 [Puccinia sorghi]|uniref:hAT-like transposase RNase-H fold domain-containing protein n=1 Tax=Puccinia sorghi TaxID=27349 RepID=A0A0L6UQ23_9BASI|nr:uncharacterized protein VP01_4695g1 [Puccinia sorghi]